jgi:hypothetical protein
MEDCRISQSFVYFINKVIQSVRGSNVFVRFTTRNI